MLRFDLPPVHSNVARLDAFFTTVFSILSIMVSFYFIVPMVIGGFVKGFFGHSKCLSYNINNFFLIKLKKEGHKENAGAKMFAAKLLFLMSSITLLLNVIGLEMWWIPLVGLALFSTLEWAANFCIACHAYGLYYKFKN